MPSTVAVTEAQLAAYEKGGGQKPKTLLLRRRFFEEFKKWAEESAGSSLKDLFTTTDRQAGDEPGDQQPGDKPGDEQPGDKQRGDKQPGGWSCGGAPATMSSKVSATLANGNANQN